MLNWFRNLISDEIEEHDTAIKEACNDYAWNRVSYDEAWRRLSNRGFGDYEIDEMLNRASLQAEYIFNNK